MTIYSDANIIALESKKGGLCTKVHGNKLRNGHEAMKKTDQGGVSPSAESIKR